MKPDASMMIRRVRISTPVSYQKLGTWEVFDLVGFLAQLLHFDKVLVIDCPLEYSWQSFPTPQEAALFVNLGQ
jgi:hypothetical protein